MSHKPKERTPLALSSRSAPTLAPQPALPPWKVMIVDDDEEILGITRMVLKDFVLDGRGLEIIYGRSGEEAKRLLAQNPDTAALMIDVVMETEHAGLDVVRHVRETQKNSFVRIILRTGQPGQAPERNVIIDYDINDYKEKTELTAQKLITTMVSALRGYRDISSVNSSRRGLEQIVRTSAALFKPCSLAQFAQGALGQVMTFLNLENDADPLQPSGFAAIRDGDAFRIIAGAGRHKEFIGRSVSRELTPEAMDKLERATRERRTIIDDTGFLGYFPTSNSHDNIVFAPRNVVGTAIGDNLLEVLSTNLAVAFDNVHLHNELRVTQEELIHTLSEVVETRSQETGHHVIRVGEFSALLGSKFGLGAEEVELLRIAAPMHDLGKIGIPDAILCKPGRYDAAEIAVMRVHPEIGFAILKSSRRSALQAAAIICRQHHEHWDGGGYPQGLKGEDIHMFGRIVALADVFDALSHERVYKPAWPLERIIGYLKEQRGRQFDPVLVDLLLAHMDEFTEILTRFP